LSHGAKKAQKGEIPHHCLEKFFRRVRTAHHDGFRKFLISIPNPLLPRLSSLCLDRRGRLCRYENNYRQVPQVIVNLLNYLDDADKKARRVQQ
jgi:hypothetical protein